jgi:hypothetical protein
MMMMRGCVNDTPLGRAVFVFIAHGKIREWIIR